jgi:hypothetical protein
VLLVVATSTTVAPAVRALCLEHLERRQPTPPTWQDGEDDDEILQ